jgi:hypothetical protein
MTQFAVGTPNSVSRHATNRLRCLALLANAYLSDIRNAVLIENSSGVLLFDDDSGFNLRRVGDSVALAI